MTFWENYAKIKSISPAVVYSILYNCEHVDVCIRTANYTHKYTRAHINYINYIHHIIIIITFFILIYIYII